MKLSRFDFVSVVVLAFSALAAAAIGCNDIGECPATSNIRAGASCSGESLECAYTLQSASPACDGTSVEGGVLTSCVCTGGNWSCPQAVTCTPASDGGDDGAPDSAAE